MIEDAEIKEQGKKTGRQRFMGYRDSKETGSASNRVIARDRVIAVIREPPKLPTFGGKPLTLLTLQVTDHQSPDSPSV